MILLKAMRLEVPVWQNRQPDRVSAHRGRESPGAGAKAVSRSTETESPFPSSVSAAPATTAKAAATAPHQQPQQQPLTKVWQQLPGKAPFSLLVDGEEGGLINGRINESVPLPQKQGLFIHKS